ncbi:DUF421 domain-containing protein [Qipengyuania sp. 1NDW9]|uniref:DUF421 domain-containing protein n=1 Tax=Qipengyuania xiapuensis TaxID=2867236 RepID=UPI001C87ECA6|nr:YetF domain-containing protein [Qipengyuania xiapuensis]MBX7493316.1 DUF421 domain-containing protein [Qipengyuania xiapuensis]
MDETADWFGNWNDIADTAVSAVLFYIFIVFLVRLTGKRSTSQLNNFDWIINITVGSLAASGILLDSVPALRALVAISVIMALQYLLTRAVLKFDWLAQLIKASPTMLTHKGEYLDEAMRETRISEEEICSALREHGLTDPADANWVVLETDGRMTVIPRKELALQDAETMGNVDAPADIREKDTA